MFERSLSSLIKGLRSHRGRDEQRYVATLMEEIKYEIRSGDMDVKAEAVLKLTYLQMLGYPPPNASFHMLEVMASPRFHLKQVGYLAASQCFNEDTDVLILATNLLKKDLRSSSPLDVAVALNGLSHIITPDLAQHLTPEIITLLTHTRPSIRKKALLVLYSVILHHPPALEQSLGRLGEKLDDEDSGVVSATINIICELSRNDKDNAQLFLTLSPQFFHLLTTSTNNWMLIKIIKLFGVLTPLEPRLVKKLVPPISSIISTTPAMSLLYECIHTMIIGGMLTSPDGDSLATTCVEKLSTFLDDEDQNLKYIALLALVKIVPTHPELVAQHREPIFDAMEDDDMSIRLRALDLVSGMAGRSNYHTIVEHQLRHLQPENVNARSSAAASLKLALQNSNNQASPSSAPWLSTSYRLEIINRILELGYGETYSNIVDFEWYVDVLIKLVYLAEDKAVEDQVCFQLIDITSRVRAVRPHAISKLKQVLEDFDYLDGNEEREIQLLRAAAWICGEYCSQISYPPALITLLLRKETLLVCSATTVSLMLHGAVKLFAWWMLQLSKEWEESKLGGLKQLTNEIADALQLWTTFEDAEVRERSVEYRQLLLLLEKDMEAYSAIQSASKIKDGSESGAALIDRKEKSSWGGGMENAVEGPRSLHLLSPLFFGYSLGPVAKKAQSKVAVPSSLDLDKWMVELSQIDIIDHWKEDGNAAELSKASNAGSSQNESNDSKAVMNGGTRSDTAHQAEEKERARLKSQRLKRERESPFYIGSKSKADNSLPLDEDRENIDEIPIVQLQLDDVLQTSAQQKEGQHFSAVVPPIVQEEEEMPEESPKMKIVKKKVGTKSKRKAKAVGEASLT